MIKKIFLASTALLILGGCSPKTQSHYAVVNESGKDGLLKDNSNVTIKPIYDNIDRFYDENERYWHPHMINLHWLHDDKGNEFSIVKYNNKYGIIRKDAKLLLKPVYDHISSFFNGFARITEGDRVGLINKNFEIVLKPKYAAVEEFYDDVTYIKSTSGLFGCIDKNMNVRIKPQFDRIYLEYNNFARVLKDDKWGMIDNQCNIIAKPIYDYANNYSKGFAKVEYNGKIGYLNTKGELMSKPIYDRGDTFQ